MRTLIIYAISRKVITLWIAVPFFILTANIHAQELLQSPLQPDKGGILFGSCLKQWQPAPALQNIVLQEPDAFVFLGDNMYSDVGSALLHPLPGRITKGYQELGLNSDFSRFRQTLEQRQIPLLATWDDHDYGKNDGGADFSFRLESKQAFMDFFELTKTVTPNSQPGIYYSKILPINDLEVQFILLDSRSFRSPLISLPSSDACPKTHFGSNTQQDATLLGEEQWRWLKEVLKQPADLRIIASSIQLLSSEHCYEKWSNFPLERQRFIDLLTATQSQGVIIISGDRHSADISRLQLPLLPYPLWEITSSGLNSAIGPGKNPGPNSLRTHANAVIDDNYARIHWQSSINSNDIQLYLEIYRSDGTLAEQVRFPLASLRSTP